MNSWRADFPMLQSHMHGKPLIYLDSAATAQKPQVVIDTITDFYQNHYGTVHRAIYELAAHATAAYQAARNKAQGFLNAAAVEEIVFTRGTTDAINLVASSFGKGFLKPGDEVLISAMEHHSNIVPWQLACQERGAILKIIPMDSKGELLLDCYAALLGPKTKIVAVAHISNALGTVNPIREMAAMAHSYGAAFLADGAQSAPHMAVDVQELDVDFYTFSGHKIYGPTGIGILYGKRRWLEEMPPYQGGGDMIETVTFEKTTFNTLPLKFEAGTPMIAEVIGLGAAIDYLTAIGLEAIAAWEHKLLHRATKALEAIDGLEIIGTARTKGAIVSFNIAGIHPLDLGTLLDLRGIAIRTGHHCAQPALRHFNLSSTARASFGLYNTLEEIDSFVNALHEIITLLKP
jgi:cysteine desulfurase/selenocysteine lyase